MVKTCSVVSMLSALLLGAAAGAGIAAGAPMGVERVARLTYPGYEAGAAADDETHWVQVDLGRSVAVDAVKLFPMIDWSAHSQGFPARFRVDLSEDPQFHRAVTIVDRMGEDVPNPDDVVSTFPTRGYQGRYVRLTASRLRDRKLVLAKLEVWSGGKDVAEGCPASDSVRGELGKSPLTRPARPQGEGVVTDHPGNVIPARQWKPVPYQAQAPTGGVRLDPGLFRTAMENNVAYLLSTSTVDEMLRPFRERAGQPNPPGLRTPDPFWDNDLAGSSAGRFLMGAGNTLRWMDPPELRRRVDRLIDGIEACRRPDGYLMAYPPESIFYSERGAYTRSWLTHGLIEAGYGGNPKAFPLLRGYYDWFDRNPYLPELLRRGGQGVQGMIANTRTYFTPAGKPEDLQVVQRYYQENYWLDELAKREDRAIWQYPYDHPHCYLLTSLEPYLDLYRATGAARYRDAALGGWELYHDKWEHVGGSIAICEGDSYPPRSYFLHRHTGELCGSVFWSRYNQRFHLLHPDQEKYAGEIEKSIYNVALANQAGAGGFRYHANLLGKKDPPDHKNTCCEGQGTRMIGSLPEYLYSLAPDGPYVNLFAPSTLAWKQRGQPMQARMTTQFPFSPEVRLRVFTSRATAAKVRVRVPAWATGPMPIRVNGALAATGKPGTYALLDRTWRDGDTVSFTLPAGFRVTRYEGAEQGAEERYALEYGPVLMALLDHAHDTQEARLAIRSGELAKRLKPRPGQPLHFALDGDPAHEYVPYWEVQDQVFTCYPVVGEAGAAARESVGPADLALASRGATASADGEYALEPGSAAKVIDGVIATPGDFSNRWHSSLATPHPHWVQVKLPKSERIGRVVIRFADPAGHPVSFQGTVRVAGKDRVLFDETAFGGWRRYEATVPPVTTDTFRLVIRSSAAPAYPNAAQVSEIELYPPGK
jgi:DUF1680 family protein